MTPREKLELLRSYRAAGGTGSYVSLLKEAEKFDGGGERKKIFLQPNDPKLPPGKVHPLHYQISTERASSIGGEHGEPAYLIPTFKYGKTLEDPVAEFNNTGEHLGGPFKTWQEAEKFGELRHKYVEKGEAIPSPIMTWGKEYSNGGPKKKLPELEPYVPQPSVASSTNIELKNYYKEPPTLKADDATPAHREVTEEYIDKVNNPILPYSPEALASGTPIFYQRSPLMYDKTIVKDLNNREIQQRLEKRAHSKQTSNKIETYVPPQKQLGRGINLGNVRELQEELISKGFDVGKEGPDGKLGKNTTKALQRFLISEGIDVGKTKDDGILGPNTRKGINMYNSFVTKSGRSPYALSDKIGVVDYCEDSRCAAYEDNALEMFYGIDAAARLAAGIFGDAWERTKNILNKGGELLYSKDTGVDLSSRVEAGDIVNIRVFGSSYQREAGDTGTHTGIVDSSVQYDNKKRPYIYVLHNVNKQIGRHKIFLDTGKMKNKVGFVLNEIVRPNVEGKEIITRMPNPNINLEVNSDNTILNNAAKQLNSLDIREKMLRNLNINEEEYFSLAKGVLGILNNETSYGTKGKVPLVPNRVELAVKQYGSKVLKGSPSKVQSLVEKFTPYRVPKEPSRGWGQIKFNSNFASKIENTEEFLDKTFGIRRKDLDIFVDNGKAAATAAMIILAKNYNRLKKTYSPEEALYLSIQQYNGFDLDRKIAGKTRRQWGEEKDLDYPNKALDFIDIIAVKDNENKTYHTLADELNLNSNVIKNQSRLSNRKI